MSEPTAWDSLPHFILFNMNFFFPGCVATSLISAMFLTGRKHGTSVTSPYEGSILLAWPRPMTRLPWSFITGCCDVALAVTKQSRNCSDWSLSFKLGCVSPKTARTAPTAEAIEWILALTSWLSSLWRSPNSLMALWSPRTLWACSVLWFLRRACVFLVLYSVSKAHEPVNTYKLNNYILDFY